MDAWKGLGHVVHFRHGIHRPCTKQNFQDTRMKGIEDSLEGFITEVNLRRAILLKNFLMYDLLDISALPIGLPGQHSPVEVLVSNPIR